MRYLVNLDGNYYTSIDLDANESKKVEFCPQEDGSRYTAVLTTDRIIKMPTKEKTGLGIVCIEYLESRNRTSEVCTIAKLG